VSDAYLSNNESDKPMKLILCTKPGLSSAFLRFIMWSKWSHSAILDGDVVIDTTLLQGGVKVHLSKHFFDHYPTYELRDIEVDETHARYWLHAQIGKRYDWTALVSFVVQRDWQEPDAWFCSELTEALISMFGKPRFRASAQRITPRHQEMLA
jgi:hypothetical protein